MKTKLLLMSAFTMFFSTFLTFAEDKPKIIEKTTFSLLGKEGVTLERDGGTQFSHVLLAHVKIRVSGERPVRIPKDGIVFQLFKDNKVFVAEDPQKIKASTAKDTGQYYKFEAGKGKFITHDTRFYVPKNTKGVFEVRLVEIRYHVDALDLIYKPEGDDFKAKIEIK